MTGLASLWLPILLSAVLVFVASSVIHMAVPWHRNDYATVPNQDQVMDALRPFAIPPGDYVVPRPGSMKEMGTPEFLEKMNRGPVLVVTVRPSGKFSMTNNLVGWFVFSLAVGAFAGYTAGRSLGPGTEYMRVFELVTLTSFAAYAVALWQMSIWYNRKLSTTVKATIDGLIYALLTAGVFGWLWPR